MVNIYMKPLTEKQEEVVSTLEAFAEAIQLEGHGGYSGPEQVALSKWKSFDPALVKEINDKFADCMMLGEDIGNLLRDLRETRKL